MALVNIIRSGGSDVHDMNLYLQNRADNRVDTTTNTVTACASSVENSDIIKDQTKSSNISSFNSDSNSISISNDGDIGDVSVSDLHNNNTVDSNAPIQYCVECEEVEVEGGESQRIVPSQDLTGALSFNQKGKYCTLLYVHTLFLFYL